MERRMNAAMLTRLTAMKAEPKFVDEPGTIYNGMRPEELRRAAEDQLNDLIEGLMRDLPKGLTERSIRQRFAATLSSFPGHDTEDRERMCRYVEQLADVAGVEKPRGLLTRWLYGWILGTLLLLTPRQKLNS